jgi:hypothetical protein
VRDVRQNKGSILKASVEYIKKLKSDQHKKRFLEEKCRIQESQNRQLLLKLQVCLQISQLLRVRFEVSCLALVTKVKGVRYSEIE